MGQSRAWMGKWIAGTSLGMMLSAGCGGGSDHGSASGDGGPALTRRQLQVLTSDQLGMARMGASTAPTEVQLFDSKTQRPVVGALVQAVAEEDGFLLRVSKDDDGLQPQALFVKAGESRTVALDPATPDLQGGLIRVGARVHSEEFLGETDLTGISTYAATEKRPDVIFLPGLDPTLAGGTTRFNVYRSLMPGTLIALLKEGMIPPDGQLVRVPGRVVATDGTSQSGLKISSEQLLGAAQVRAGEDKTAPVVSAITVATPDVYGNSMLNWNIQDPEQRLYAVDIGVDSTVPDRRIAKDSHTVAISVRRGAHFACVRPVFAGSDVDPQLRCMHFDALNAPAAANIRVNVQVMSSSAPVLARQGVPVKVEVQNDGDTDSAPFDVNVVVSRDGRPEGGLGEVRVIHVDGVKAKSSTNRMTSVTPPHDGHLFVVAQADPLKTLVEGNSEDNNSHAPLTVDPVGNNRAPILSLGGGARSSGGSVARGDVVALRANATDPEEGDLSAHITWWSSRDGYLGLGATVTPTNLSAGLHRITARVADGGLPAVVRRPRLSPAVQATVLDPSVAAKPFPGGLRLTTTDEPPETVNAEFSLEVVERTAPLNSSPVASAGPDLTLTEGGQQALAASAHDGDGDPLTFTWTVTAADGTIVTGSLDNAALLRPLFVPPGPGLFTLNLAVSDGKTMVKDDVMIRVLAASANHPPVVTLLLPAASHTGVAAQAQITASDPDGDAVSLSYRLDRPAASKVLLGQADSFMPTFAPDQPGSYTLVVQADDGRGGTARATAVTVAEGLPVVDPTPTGDGGVEVSPGVDAGAPMGIHAGAELLMAGLDVELAPTPLVPAMSTATTGMMTTTTGTMSNPGGGDPAPGRPCDPVSGFCAMVRQIAVGAAEAELYVVNAASTQAQVPMKVGAATVLANPGSGMGNGASFINGTLLFTTTNGDAWVWRPGWGAPQKLASDAWNGCTLSPARLYAVCLTNSRQSDGGMLVDLTLGPVGEGAGTLPAWRTIFRATNNTQVGLTFAPDDSWIVLLSQASATIAAVLELQPLPLAMGKPYPVQAGTSLTGTPRVSPDSKRVAFFRTTGTAMTGQPATGTLLVTDLGANPVAKTLLDNVIAYRWLDAGTAAQMGLWVMVADTRGGYQFGRIPDLASPTFVMVADKVLPQNLDISPDGTQVAMLRNTDGDAVSELWTGNTDGTGLVRITKSTDIEIRTGASFSAGSGKLLFGVGRTATGRTDQLRVSLLPNPTADGVILGRSVGDWQYTQVGQVIYNGEILDGDGVPHGVLHRYDGVSLPTVGLQAGVHERFSMAGHYLVYVVSGQGGSDGLYRLSLDLP